MENNLKPATGKVLIKPSKEEKITESGIVLPDSSDKNEYQEGIVIEVGSGKYEDGQNVPVEIKTGDKVIYKSYQVLKIKVNGTEHVLIDQDEVIGIWK